MIDLGTLTFTIPSYLLEDGTTTTPTTVIQNYNNDFDSNIYTRNSTGFTYLALGGSRLDEKRRYGANPFEGAGLVFDVDNEGLHYTGYTFNYTGETMSSQTLYYRDYENGYTLITGQTSGFTQEVIFNSVLTRNEHFLGFVEQPRVYSDIFVERGKQGVMENNFRLGEIRSTGELDYYGNKYFNVQKT